MALPACGATPWAVLCVPCPVFPKQKSPWRPGCREATGPSGALDSNLTGGILPTGARLPRADPALGEAGKPAVLRGAGSSFLMGKYQVTGLEAGPEGAGATVLARCERRCSRGLTTGSQTGGLASWPRHTAAMDSAPPQTLLRTERCVNARHPQGIMGGGTLGWDLSSGVTSETNVKSRMKQEVRPQVCVPLFGLPREQILRHVS